MLKPIEDYIAKLKEADNQLEELISLRRKVEPAYQIGLPFTFIMDKNYCVLYANIVCLLSLNAKPSTFFNKISIQIRTIINSVFYTGDTLKFINHIDIPNRGKRVFECVVSPLYGDQGNIEVVIIYASDMTERLAVEEELRKQKQLYENIVENLPDIVARHDRNHRYLFVNRALERISGIPPYEIVGKTFDNLGFPEETWRPWYERCEEVFQTGESVTFDTEFASPRGIITVETILIPEPDNKGNIETILTISRVGPRQLKYTLAALEQVNEELRKQKRYFATILNNIPMIICRFDRELRHIYVNPALETLCGVKPEQCLGKTWHEMGMEGSIYLAFQRFYEEVISTGQATEFETHFPNSFSEILYFRTMVIPEMDEFGRVQTLLSISQDITAKKKLEAELLRLDRLNIIGEMAASIGHEVRNPMTTVRGYLQIFQHKPEYAQYRDQLATMIEELDRANTIISDFLSLSKNKTVELKLNNLNAVISALIPMLQADALHTGHNIQVDLSYVPDIGMDEKEIRQLLLNLARNGFEAMESGGMLTIQSYWEKDKIVLTIGDTGKGIPPEVLAKLGTPFLTTKETGTGLGLPICYRIAEHHGAKIDVKTSPQGTTFMVYFKI